MNKRIIVIIMIVLIAFIICDFSYAIQWYNDNWTERQNIAHEIAELARSINLPEDDIIILRAQEIWWEDELASDIVKPGVAQEESQIDFYNGILPYEITYNPETEELAIMFAKTIFCEARGIKEICEQAAIVQTVYNRSRSERFGYPTVYQALTAPNQFAYRSWGKTVDDYGRDLVALARDVIYRNALLDQGYAEDEVGIVLGAGYCYYSGDGYHNYFRNAYTNGTRWDWSLPNPYES